MEGVLVVNGGGSISACCISIDSGMRDTFEETVKLIGA